MPEFYNISAMKMRTTGYGGRVFRCQHEGPFILQTQEVAYGHFIDLDEALRLSAREAFTSDGVEILQKIQTYSRKQ